jgi:DNA-directed RNA polymerase specialized sigma24 family protein
LKFRTILNKHIEDNYHKYRQLALNIAKNQVDADDLLHTVLVRIIESPATEAVVERGNLHHYIHRALYLSYHSNTSDYAVQYRTPDRPTDQSTPEEISHPDLGALINSENINAAIQRLSEIDRLLILLYKDVDFSYEDVNKATGIPVSYLRERIYHTTNYIRTYVRCATGHSEQEVIYLPKL